MDSDFTLLPCNFEDVFVSQYELELRSPFRLFDLPPELWTRICSFAVTRDQPMKIGKEKMLKDSAAIVRQPAITRTCRLLRTEALPLFYACNDFEMIHSHGVPCSRQWLSAIGDAGRKGMGSLLMHSNCDASFWKGSFDRAGVESSILFVEDNGATVPDFLFMVMKTYRISFA